MIKKKENESLTIEPSNDLVFNAVDDRKLFLSVSQLSISVYV